MILVGAIAALPFTPLGPDALLGLDWSRPGVVDDDYRGFGWGFVPHLVLEGDEGVYAELAAPLVLALHNAPPEDAVDGGDKGDFLLEFDVDGERLHVGLEAFLRVWLPQLPATETIVLALCNPEGKVLGRPTGLPAGTRLVHALGDVDSWGEDDGHGHITHGLRARAWRMG